MKKIKMTVILLLLSVFAAQLQSFAIYHKGGRPIHVMLFPSKRHWEDTQLSKEISGKVTGLGEAVGEVTAEVGGPKGMVAGSIIQKTIGPLLDFAGWVQMRIVTGGHIYDLTKNKPYNRRAWNWQDIIANDRKVPKMIGFMKVLRKTLTNMKIQQIEGYEDLVVTAKTDKRAARKLKKIKNDIKKYVKERSKELGELLDNGLIVRKGTTVEGQLKKLLKKTTPTEINGLASIIRDMRSNLNLYWVATYENEAGKTMMLGEGLLPIAGALLLKTVKDEEGEEIGAYQIWQWKWNEKTKTGKTVLLEKSKYW